MRSSKNRSRSKNNRNNRSVGNIVNRVFDSSGPEGKVRGTPQQIIDKYLQLTRDAQLANDRVAAENFQQHAEHYTRMLGEAQREQEARRAEQEAQQREAREAREAKQEARQNEQRQAAREADAAAPVPGTEEQPDLLPEQGQEAVAPVIDGNSDSGLVETPESAPKPKQRRPRRPRKTDAEAAAPEAKSEPGPEAAE